MHTNAHLYSRNDDRGHMIPPATIYFNEYNENCVESFRYFIAILLYRLHYENCIFSLYTYIRTHIHARARIYIYIYTLT